MSFNHTFTAALFALSLVTVAGAAQAQDFAWEQKINANPVLEQQYNSAGDGPTYQSYLNETFAE